MHPGLAAAVVDTANSLLRGPGGDGAGSARTDGQAAAKPGPRSLSERIAVLGGSGLTMRAIASGLSQSAPVNTAAAKPINPDPAMIVPLFMPAPVPTPGRSAIADSGPNKGATPIKSLKAAGDDSGPRRARCSLKDN